MTKKTWYCENCGAQNYLNTGANVSGSRACAECATWHPAADILADKHSTPPRQTQVPQSGTSDAPNVNRTRLYLGALGVAIQVFQHSVFILWEFFGTSVVPMWLFAPIADNGPVILVLRMISWVLLGIGLTGTYRIKPQLWYLAGLVAWVMALREMIFWFLGPENLSGYASGITDLIALTLVDLIRLIPVEWIFLGFLIAGAFELKDELGAALSSVIFGAGLFYVVLSLAFTLGVTPSFLFGLNAGGILWTTCLIACGLGLVKLSRPR